MNLTKVKDNLESRIIKILGTKNPIGKVVSNATVGCLPGKVQKRIASKGKFNALKLTYCSIGVGLAYTIFQYAVGDSIDHIPVLKYLGKGGKFMGIYGLVNEAIRGGYTLVTQQPIGSLILEIPDRIAHSQFLWESCMKINRWFYGI